MLDVCAVLMEDFRVIVEDNDVKIKHECDYDFLLKAEAGSLLVVYQGFPIGRLHFEEMTHFPDFFEEMQTNPYEVWSFAYNYIDKLVYLGEFQFGFKSMFTPLQEFERIDFDQRERLLQRLINYNASSESHDQSDEMDDHDDDDNYHEYRSGDYDDISSPFAVMPEKHIGTVGMEYPIEPDEDGVNKLFKYLAENGYNLHSHDVCSIKEYYSGDHHKMYFKLVHWKTPSAEDVPYWSITFDHSNALPF